MNNRSEKGQFQKTTGSTKYKRVEYGGNSMLEHQRNFCIVLGIDRIPKGFIVHHLDKDKLNNDINNLALMTITAHNRIHSHIPWNKGLTTEDNEKWNQTIAKAIKSRKRNYVAMKGGEVYKLKAMGLSFRQIAKQLGISRETASRRLGAYLEHEKLIDPTMEKRVDRFNQIRELKCVHNLSWEEVGRRMNKSGSSVRRFYSSFFKLKLGNKNGNQRTPMYTSTKTHIETEV